MRFVHKSCSEVLALLKLMAKLSKTLVRPEFDSCIPHLPVLLDKKQLYVTDQLDETVLFAFWRTL